MLESNSLTPKPKKRKIYLPLANSSSQNVNDSTDSRQFSQRIKIRKQYTEQISRKQPLPSKRFPSFFQNSQISPRIADSRAIKLAQSELQDKYKCDLSGYLRKKFKQYLGKRQAIDHRESLIKTLSRSSLSSQKPITSYRKLLTIEKNQLSKCHKSTVVNEAYLLNAKERIDRMVALKKQRDHYYSDIRAILKKKIVEKAKSRQKKEWETERKEEEWQRKWVNDYISEKNRYRKRLLNKNINKRYQYSP